MTRSEGFRIPHIFFLTPLLSQAACRALLRQRFPRRGGRGGGVSLRWVLTTPSQPGSDGVTFFSSLPFSIVADDRTQTKRGGRSNRARTGPTYTVLYGGYHLIRGHNIYSLMDKAPRSVIKTRVRARRVPQVGTRVCRACRRACSVCGAGERGGLSDTFRM